jgi:uncharacterized coiled-coil protein SlyX
MKQSTKMLAGAFITTLAITASTVPAFAQSGVNAEVKAATLAAKCTTLTTKIDDHITKINAAIAKQTATYDKHDAKVEALIAKAKAAGADTTKAEADLQAWEGQTTAVKNARSQVITDLNALKGLQCADQKDQYKQGLANAKIQLQDIRTLQNNKKAYFTSTIKPDLQAIRDQLKNQ